MLSIARHLLDRGHMVLRLNLRGVGKGPNEKSIEDILADAAADAGAAVAMVEKRRQARDHPIRLGVPETYYLKCLVLRKL